MSISTIFAWTFLVVATLSKETYADCPSRSNRVKENLTPGIADKLSELLKEYDSKIEGRRPQTSDEYTTIEEIVSRKGYPLESHVVTTEDCYLLTMHRIPFGAAGLDGDLGPPVLLQHRLLLSSVDWVIPDPAKGLAYILADAGYDVWMGNFRGNVYSRNHCNLDPDVDDDFWSFSWDQKAKWDLPAMIDAITLYTGQDKIHYIGHSEGSTALMAMTQERPEYMDKLIMANLMSPVSYVEGMQGPIRLLTPFVDVIEDLNGDGQFSGSGLLWDLISDLYCHPALKPDYCNPVFVLLGYNAPQMNETLLPEIDAHNPGGTSIRTILHYAQEVEGGFHKYDLGVDNELCYGVDYPPVYYPQNFTMPLSIYWGQNSADYLVSVEDVLRLISELPNVYFNFEIPLEHGFFQLDYVYGVDAPVLVWNQVMANMERAQQEFYPISDDNSGGKWNPKMHD